MIKIKIQRQIPMKTPGKIKTQSEVYNSQISNGPLYQILDNLPPKQLKPSPKLRKRYPPHEVFHQSQFERVNELKHKYFPVEQQPITLQNSKQKASNCNKQNYEDTPRGNIHGTVISKNNEIPGTENRFVHVTQFVSKMKEQIQGTRQLRLQQNNFDEETSVVTQNFMSNPLQEQSGLTKTEDNELIAKDFIDKVQQVNRRIEGRIGLLESKIKQIAFLRKKKQMQKESELQRIQQQKQSQIQQELQEQTFTEREMIIQRERDRRFEIQKQRERQALRLRQQQREIQQLKHRKLQINNKKTEYITQSFLMESSKTENQQHQENDSSAVRLPQSFMKKSICQELMGKFKGSDKFPKEFTVLVNRIRQQIEMDVEFTKIVLNMNHRILSAVKQYLQQKYPQMDTSYLQITPMEIDPLIELSQETYQNNSIPQLADWIYRMYSKIQKSFSTKLYQRFEGRTIDILLQEIQSNSQSKLTIGHLASYLNMRTGQQFRNRSLVKLLRRMNICSQTLDRANFRRVFGKKILPEIKE